MDLVEGVLSGNRLALARLITQVENMTPEGMASLDKLFPSAGKAHLVGITGSPGTGKSTVVNKLAQAFRHPDNGSNPLRVGIIAVDPSSPFTGGALLGDRLRMKDLFGDPGIFIRSMASRGSVGGLARATANVVQVLDAAGFDIVLIETVGAGQTEVEIARLAHTVAVVEAPGLGDDIQAIKAGILEIADILIVNKDDRPGVESTVRALRSMLELGYSDTKFDKRYQKVIEAQDDDDMEVLPSLSREDGLWTPPVLQTVATRGSGIYEVAQMILEHGRYLHTSGEWKLRERNRLQSELDNLLNATLVYRWRSHVPKEIYHAVLNQMFDRHVSPYQAIAKLLKLDYWKGEEDFSIPEILTNFE
jgi:LAO/AO transport system kinase